MRQNTLFGGLPASITTSGTIKHEGRGVLVPNLRNDVQFVYDEAEKTFALVKELLPDMKFELVTKKERLDEYMQAIKKAGVVALDTEVNGLNPRMDAIAGISLFTPKESSIYIPVNHDFYDNNLDARYFIKELNALANSGKVRVIMHNARFDTRVLYNYTKEWTPVFADTMVAAHMLNENESKNLKYQWNQFCMKGQYTEMSYNDLFEKRKYGSFNPDRVYIYAALDTVMTLQLWVHQFKYIGRREVDGSFQYSELTKRLGLEQVSNWFWDNEMKVTRIAAHMEERGIGLDLERNAELRKKYGKEVAEVTKRATAMAMDLLAKYEHRIPRDKYLKISNPIAVTSSSQLSTLLYDGYGVQLSEALLRQITNKKKKTAKDPDNIDTDVVGANVLKYFKGEYPDLEEFLDEVLKLRKLSIIESTFLTSLRASVDPISGRVHGGWNNLGTKTGRFSSKEPNLQNIPADNEDIRPQFIAGPGRVFIGSDFAAQEPRVLAEVSKDKALIANFVANRDIYATLYELATGSPYEENLETKDGEFYPEGKKRRGVGKILQLALTYGMGVQAVADIIKLPLEEAEEVVTAFKDNLPGVTAFETKLKEFARKNGFVPTMYGTRCRFPNYALEPLEVKSQDGSKLDASLVASIKDQINKVWSFNDKNSLRKELEVQYNVKIKDNSGYIKEDETKILNGVIQGKALPLSIKPYYLGVSL